MNLGTLRAMNVPNYTSPGLGVFTILSCLFHFTSFETGYFGPGVVILPS